jgi:predicted ATP-grasp superfamily ATP-dependent carboligase
MADATGKGAAVVLAHGVNGLGVVRSLHQAGYSTVVVAPAANDLVMYSRLPAAKHVLRDSDRWPQELLQLLEGLRFPNKPPIVACDDLAATFLAEHREALQARYSVLVPQLAVVQALNDKRLELELMTAKGIRIPASVTRLEDLDPATDFDGLPFPMLVKPRTHVGMALIRAKNIVVEDKAALQAVYERYRDHLHAFVMQEVITGGDTTLWLCSAAFDAESNLVAAFTFQRLGAMPFHYGVTSIGESRPNERITALVADVGRRLGCVGPTDLEFMHDARIDEFVYIEINPRIGMNNWFDTSSGVNVIGSACDAALGVPARAYQQQPGVIFANVLGDLTARLEVRQSPRQIARVYWSLRARRKSWAVYRRGDAWPAVVSLVRGLQDLATRAMRQVTTRAGAR